MRRILFSNIQKTLIPIIKNKPLFSMIGFMYHDRVIDHFDNPRNVGSFDIDNNVGTGKI